VFLIVLILSIYYFSVLFFLSLGIWKLKRPSVSSTQHEISVIVAARNEEANILRLINCLLQQNYSPKRYELIIVDDRSEDRTAEIVTEAIKTTENLRLLRIPIEEQGGKKRALARGISQARYSILAFTDADCLPSPDWLQEISNHFTPEVSFIGGYSPLISDKNNFWIRLKNLERLSIFAVSAGSMGWNLGLTITARNMAYRKELYNKVNGFSGLENIPSGDDDLMLQRMSPYSKKMNFMFTQGSIVPSYDNKNLSGQINLETRRASKWRYYPFYIKIGTALVFLYYLAFFLMLLFFLIGKLSFHTFILLLLIKILAELIILIPFFQRIRTWQYLPLYPVALILHLPYFIFFGLKGTFGKYKWKS